MPNQTDKGQILIYQTHDGQTKLEVTLQDDTVWLSIDQMAELFQRDYSTISKHINKIFADGELNPKVVVAFFANTTQHGAIEGKHQRNTTSSRNVQRTTFRQ